MPLVNVKDLLFDAAKNNYAVGAFNCNNMEILQAIIRAAEEEDAPVIIQASQGAIKYAGLDYIASMGKLAAEKSSVPAALHLDHGTSIEQVIQCIRHGFSSVMFDGSSLPFDDNAALTKEVVEIAHAVDVSVEGELGRICGTEDDISVCDRDASLTDPGEAKSFVEFTGVDSLAVSIGTAHGRYKGTPDLDFERLERIGELVDIPLVMHGASGVPSEDICRAIPMGIRKINIDTDIREAFVTGIMEALEEDPHGRDPRNILGHAREKMQEIVGEKMRLFGCAHRIR
ncbi:MAG: class II fructose-1,6-bisphosphate aldolase [Clostridia bacterium]|nr:class II fructose-1,6-bisphosphate aldolase [Clostridia bacterium]